METPTKSWNPTVLGQGVLASTQWSPPSRFCHWRPSFGDNGYPPFNSMYLVSVYPMDRTNKYKLEKLFNQHKTFDLLQIYFNICPWVKISPKILFSFQKSSHYEWGGLQNYFPVGYRRTFIVFHQFHWTDWQFLVGGQKFKTACPESVSSFTACPCNIWYSKSSQTFTLWFFSNYI